MKALFVYYIGLAYKKNEEFLFGSKQNKISSINSMFKSRARTVLIDGGLL